MESNAIQLVRGREKSTCMLESARIKSPPYQHVLAHYLPLVRVPKQRLELERRHAGEVNRVRVGPSLSCGTISHRKREHGAKDGRVLGQKVPVGTKKTVLDLLTRKW